MYSMSGGEPSGATPRTTGRAVPKIIRDGRTFPILSENFSAHTRRTGRRTSWRILVASARPMAGPRRTRSNEQCVCPMPKAPEIQVATDGISRELVQVHDDCPDLLWTHLGVSQRRPGGPQREILEAARGVTPLLDAGLG